MVRIEPGATTSTDSPTAAGTGAEFRSLAAGTAVERRRDARARSALA